MPVAASSRQEAAEPARAYVQLGVWIILFPGLFPMLTVLSINLIGDGLRDLLKV